MPSRRSRSALSLSIQAAELATAVPQVVAHRLTRMALAGAQPSARDRKEFDRMVAEKKSAFSESWAAMAMQAAAANQALAMSMWRSLWTPAPWGAHKASSAAAAQWQNAALGVLNQGLKPVHRRAVANAKRLRSTPLR